MVGIVVGGINLSFASKSEAANSSCKELAIQAFKFRFSLSAILKGIVFFLEVFVSIGGAAELVFMKGARFTPGIK